MAARHTYKDAQGNKLPSVTQIIGRFRDSGALLYWANKVGREQGLTLDQARQPAADAGTMAHDLVEAHLNKRELPELVGDEDVIAKARKAFDAFLSWEAAFGFEALYTEVSLASGKHKFGGTLDAIGKVRGSNQVCLFDWKSSNAIYADYLYQLAAYKILWNETYPDTLVGGAHLCRFSKDTGDFAHHFFAELDAEAETFLVMRQLFDLVKTTEKRVK